MRTRAARAAIGTDPEHGAVIPPLHTSSTFTFEGFDRPRKYDYTRSGNPTRDLLADAIADLEEGVGGVVTSTGMSAITTCVHLLGPEDVLVAPTDAYGGTHRLFTALERRGGFRLELVDLWNPDALERVAELEPRMIWVETPSNPLLRITDIRAAVEVGRRSGALVVVDNTFLSPALQRPLTLGADLVVHSTTKFLNGHSDVVGGAIVGADEPLLEEIAWWANCLGVTGSPYDAHQTLRGMRTLFARVEQHARNTESVVEALTAHPAVGRIYWPGLPGHGGHDVARAQQDGFGSLVSFELADRGAVAPFVEGLRHISLAESLGGVESLLAHPATMTHAAMDEDARRAAGIADTLVRISVGIEDPADLVSDLSGALDRALEGGHRDGPEGGASDEIPVSRTRRRGAPGSGPPAGGPRPRLRA